MFSKLTKYKLSKGIASPKTTGPMLFCAHTAHQTLTFKVVQRNFMNCMGIVQTLSTKSGEKEVYKHNDR
jgi:hypothetical protein